jgi:hypothetical protein
VHSYRNVLKIPLVSVKKGRSRLWNVQYQVEKVLASIMSDTPLMKNMVQKNASKFATENYKETITKKILMT